jgi:hypothetical protein
MSETQTENPKAEKKAAPKFVFVLNERLALYTLHWREGIKNDKDDQAARRKDIGPGLNLVAESVLSKVLLPGETLEDTHKLSIVDPLKLRDGQALDMIKRTSSRQALIEWRKRGPSTAVADALTVRLDKPKASAETD